MMGNQTPVSGGRQEKRLTDEREQRKTERGERAPGRSEGNTIENNDNERRGAEMERGEGRRGGGRGGATLIPAFIHIT